MHRLSLGQFSGLLVAAMGLCAGGAPPFSRKGCPSCTIPRVAGASPSPRPSALCPGNGLYQQSGPSEFWSGPGMGGMSFALVSALCGWVTALVGPGIIPLLLLFAALLLGSATVTFRHGDPAVRTLSNVQTMPIKPAQPFLKKYPQCLPLLIGAILLCTSHNVLATFCLQIVQPLGGTGEEMGQVLTLQGIMDIPAMVLFAVLLRRARARTWVRLAGISFFLHALLSWVAPNLPFLYFIQIFEMTGYAIYAVSLCIPCQRFSKP